MNDASEVHEDIGYQQYGTGKKAVFPVLHKVTIEYIRGMMMGRTATLRRDFADDLIKRGFAREVKE